MSGSEDFNPLLKEFCKTSTVLMSLADIFIIMKSLKLNLYRRNEAVKIENRNKIVYLGWKFLNIGGKVNKIKQKCLSLQVSRRIVRMSLYCLFLYPL